MSQKRLIYKVFHLFSDFYKKLCYYIPSLKALGFHKELGLLAFFCFGFFVVLMRVFYLQVVKVDYYEGWLTSQHFSESELLAQRGNIYVTDRSQKAIKLTENITLYTLFVDPELLGDKANFIALMTPIIYHHLCVLNGFNTPTEVECIQNVEDFTTLDLLPKKPEVFYLGQEQYSEDYYSYDWDTYNKQYEAVLSGFTMEYASTLIATRLDQRVKSGFRDYNPLGFFPDVLVKEIQDLNLSYLTVKYGNYLYIEPAKVSNIANAKRVLSPVFQKYGYASTVEFLDKALIPQKHRYVRIISDANPLIAQRIKQLKQLDFYRNKAEKEEYLNEVVPVAPLLGEMRPLLEDMYKLDYNPKVKYRYKNTPIQSGTIYVSAPMRELYGVGLEPYTKRYYPYGSFMAHLLGYMNSEGQPFIGIEEYFQDLLKGNNGKISGRSSAWIGQIGANDFEIDEVENGSDVYLTIDPSIQRKIENIADYYQKSFRSDSVSILVYNPYSGTIISSVNAPTFDPNNYAKTYALRPLGPEDKYVLDDATQVDVPVFVSLSGEIRKATTLERQDPALNKYISNNVHGPVTFVDKNISYSYEPGSIFKAFTYSIGLDSDEIGMYDLYDDPEGKIKIGPYTIKNADKNCNGTHNFLYALQYSCNVGMVRIAQQLSKYVFYNYVQKLGFGQKTGIELGGEDKGFVDSVNKVSDTRFLNNSFGQGLLATPLQIAVAYGSFFNGGNYLKPTIVDKICHGDTCEKNTTKIVRRVFSDQIADDMKYSLEEVLANPENAKRAALSGYSLGGKSGTSQIAFRGKYMDGAGWTNTSFVGITTVDHLKYVIVVQVRRPRQSQWGAQTAGRIFKDVAQFLVGYELIES